MGRLVFDGFPKTGNAFLANSLRLAFPDYEIDWGGHRITTLRKENAITSIRNPIDALASCLRFFDVPISELEGYADWYNRFLIATLEHFDFIYAIKFEDLIKNPDSCLDSFAKKFNLTKSNNITENEVFSLTEKTHPAHLPKSNHKELKKKVLESNYVIQSLELYDKVLEQIDKEIDE